jgi:hypothetical protein
MIKIKSLYDNLYSYIYVFHYAVSSAQKEQRWATQALPRQRQSVVEIQNDQESIRRLADFARNEVKGGQI